MHDTRVSAGISCGRGALRCVAHSDVILTLTADLVRRVQAAEAKEGVLQRLVDLIVGDARRL